MRIDARRAAAACLGLVVLAGGCRARGSAADRLGSASAGSRDRLDGATIAADPDPGGVRTCDASSDACAPDAYCSFEPHLCGKGKLPGTCRLKPVDCHDAYAPVCGCDGNVHRSECAAFVAGIDLDVNGGCRDTVPDWIACGPRFCDARTSYCEIVLSDVFELPTDYTCKLLPPACVPEGDVARGCDCFPAGTRCLSFCGYIESGGLRGFHLTCRL